MENDNYKYDKSFLLELDNYPNKIIHAKIISLTQDELPQEEITGKITSGSINIDGASAVRRTCSLSMIANDVNLHSFYWGLSTKFKLEIGVENHINENYPDIIWFKQGIYVITSFSTSQSLNSYNISISGKDKMALLNGEQGGTLTALSYVFHEEDIKHESGYIETRKIKIKDIIYNTLVEFGKEQPHNIIINDLEDYGLELLKYNLNEPMYLVLDSDNTLKTMFLNKDQKVYFNNSKVSLEALESKNFNFNLLFDLNPQQQQSVSKISLTSGGKEYSVAKIIKGQPIGYRLTDITYAGELVGNAGENVVSILDKIKNQLGDFEYFYDVEGRFIFQRTKNYVNVAYTPIVTVENGTTKDQFVTPSELASSIGYDFTGNKLVVSMNNSPALQDLKNDYTVWGTRTSTLGNEIPIHMRYAIDKKPTSYTRIAVSGTRVKEYNEMHGTNIQTQTSTTFTTDDYDWRELIYRMALDYRKYSKFDDFYYLVEYFNPTFSNGITGYEDYYVDMEGFWRQIYNPSQSRGSDYYGENEGEDKKYWHKNVLNDPGSLNFWIDFFDNDSELSKYSIPLIGRRQFAKNDSDVKALYTQSVPLIIFYENEEDKNKKTGYSYQQLKEGISKYMTISSLKKSAAEEINALFYQKAVVAEGISLTTIPIYYLEPNCRILVKDDKNLNINGEYVATKFSIQLGHGGTMSITASKVITDF